MCNFCKPKEEIKKKESLSLILEMILVDKDLKLTYDAYSCDSSFQEYIEINYCPMCGKKLEKNS